MVQRTLAAIAGLHSSARRFCMEHHRATPYYWQLLRDIEYTIPADFTSFDQLSLFLIDTSLRVSTHQKKVENSPEGKSAQVAFQQFIETVDELAMPTVALLPLRHYLTPTLAAPLRARWRTRWQIDGGYWYPLGPLPAIADEVIAFDAAWFDEQITANSLLRLFDAHGIQQAWEWKEDGEFIIAAITLTVPSFYGSSESFWTSEQLDWMLYQSHEASTTVGGEWLVAAIKDNYPTWQQHLYVNQ